MLAFLGGGLLFVALIGALFFPQLMRRRWSEGKNAVVMWAFIALGAVGVFLIVYG